MRRTKSQRRHKQQPRLRQRGDISMALLAAILLTILVLMALPPDIWPVWRRLTRALAVSVAMLTTGMVALMLWWRRRHHRRLLAHAHTLHDLLAISPTEFELATGEMLRAWGYHNVQHSGGSGDLAADLTCLDRHGCRVIVQCKRYAPGRAIGSPEIQKFIGMMSVHHHASMGIFVTTSTFTQPACALARQHPIQLIDGEQLDGMLALIRLRAPARQRANIQCAAHSTTPATPTAPTAPTTPAAPTAPLTAHAPEHMYDSRGGAIRSASLKPHLGSATSRSMPG